MLRRNDPDNLASFETTLTEVEKQTRINWLARLLHICMTSSDADLSAPFPRMASRLMRAGEDLVHDERYVHVAEHVALNRDDLPLLRDTRMQLADKGLTDGQTADEFAASTVFALDGKEMALAYLQAKQLTDDPNLQA